MDPEDSYLRASLLEIQAMGGPDIDPEDLEDMSEEELMEHLMG